MMNLNKRVLLTLLMAVSIPLLNACKEDIDDQNSLENEFTETNEPEGSVGTPQQPEPTFEPIQINAAPADLSGYPGQTATFAVAASSAASLSYQWFHQGQAIAGANASSYTFTIVDDNDAGTYRVDISNSTTTVSDSAILLVSDLPTITSEPQDVSVYPGETATFSVDASGDNVEYQWQSRSFFGWRTLEATSDTLTIESVDSGTAKQYRVKVKNGGGEKTSRTTRINLKNSISISSQPANQLVAAGSNATFSVAASGYGTLSYQWYKGGAAITDGSKYQGSRSANLSVVNVALSDASLYHAVVSNEDGRSMTSNAAELSVQGPAVVTVHPNNTSLYSGQSGSLVIAASGDNPINYQWQKWNGSSWANVAGATSSQLTFASASSSNAGRYRCTVSNAVASDISREATVTVLEAVSISRSPASQTAEVGSSVEFTVAATGDDLQYEWTKNGQTITGSGPTLSFASVRELDAATYSCRVYNNGGSANCASFTLSIQAPATIVTQPVSQSTYEGGSVSLSVAASGIPAPTVTWLFNGNQVGSGATLALNYITPEQAGTYQCRVENELGAVDCEQVTVTVSSSVRITEQPANTTANEGDAITLNIAASGDDLNYEWSKDGQNLNVSGNSLTLTDLTAANAGAYSCRVWNEHSSANCNSFSVTINGRIAITSQPTGTTAYEDANVALTVAHNGNSDARVEWYFNDSLIASNSATLSLSPLTLEQAGEYRCVVSNSVNSVACNPVTVAVLEKARITKQPSSQMLSTGDSFVLDIEATGAGTLYYECFHNGSLILAGSDPRALVVDSVTSNNEGNYYCTVSNEGSSATSELASLTVLAIQARSVIVNWDAPTGRADGSMLDPQDISGYSIHVCPEGNTAFETVAVTTGTTTETIIELIPGTYTLTVTAHDTTGLESSMSTERVFTID
ncbi:hypothetical protein Kalk_14810 [Ketobacter alkanivorans]|uniref:Immunoglobulin I-set domain protein n=2 Tax=Ketobacter alkanivorans TaxID=1917421 RepID=A0A2K9LS04_9GAMM|nr:hypothetical protein Kalk_14810 [Ketobacter alkanivorans]